METEILKKIGLTDSESKVYLALLKLGDFSSKGKILEEAKTAPSKIYYVLNKLIEKGLVSIIIKNNVKHFLAAPPKRLKDYINEKKEIILKEEEEVDEILPKLESYYKSLSQKVKAEIFVGWRGMETVYKTLIDSTSKNESVYVLGASEGMDKIKTKKFFLRYSSKAYLKKIDIKIIFNNNAKNYVSELETDLDFKFNKKFLPKTSPVELLITKKVSAIVILKEEPIIILIHDKETSQSFITYFKELWKIAKS